MLYAPVTRRRCAALILALNAAANEWTSFLEGQTDGQPADGPKVDPLDSTTIHWMEVSHVSIY